MTEEIDVCFIYYNPIDKNSSEFAPLPVTRTAEICDSAGLQFHVAYAGTADRSLFRDANVTVHKFERSSSRLARQKTLIRAVRRIEAEHDIDVFVNVWGHYKVLHLLAGTDDANVLLRIVGDQLSLTDRSSFRGKAKYVAGRMIERAALHLSDYAYFNSAAIRDKIDSSGRYADSTYVISQGVNTDVFKPTDADREPLFLFAGRLDSEAKGVKQTVKCFERFQSEYPELNAKLGLAGRGEPRPDIRERIDDNEDIELLGMLDQEVLATYYGRATGLLLLSESEALPNVVLEALATELPVIASPVGEIPRLLESGGGFLVEEDDTDHVIQRMAALLTDSEKQAKMGQNGRRYVQQEHSFSIVKEKYRGMFKQIVEE